MSCRLMSMKDAVKSTVEPYENIKKTLRKHTKRLVEVPVGFPLQAHTQKKKDDAQKCNATQKQ